VTSAGIYHPAPRSVVRLYRLLWREADRDHVDVTRTRPKEGRALDTGALASRESEPSSGDDDGCLSDSDPDLSSVTDVRARPGSAIRVRG